MRHILQSIWVTWDQSIRPINQLWISTRASKGRPGVKVGANEPFQNEMHMLLPGGWVLQRSEGMCRLIMRWTWSSPVPEKTGCSFPPRGEKTIISKVMREREWHFFWTAGSGNGREIVDKLFITSDSNNDISKSHCCTYKIQEKTQDKKKLNRNRTTQADSCSSEHHMKCFCHFFHILS